MIMKHITLPYISPNLNLNNNVVLVGNSSLLLGKYGKLIDSYDTVFRFNRSPIKNFEEHVGTRTDFRILNNHVFENVNPGNDYTNQPLKFIKKIKNSNIIRIGPGEPRNKTIKSFERKKNKIYLFDYEKSEEIKELLKFKSNKNMSVGAIMISLCILSGVETNIIGFDLKEVSVTHYWEDRPNKMSNSHDFSFEKKWVRELVNKGVINSIS